MPDITWTEGYGQVNPGPLYGTAVNYSLLDLASDNHLEQLIHENTRQNHILDLVFCTNSEHISKVKVIPGISDHEAVFFCFSSNPLTYQKTKHNIYLYNKGDFGAIKQHIGCFQASFLSSDPYNNTLQENWSSFKSELETVIDQYIPQIPAKSTRHLPWLNKNIKTKMKRRKQQYDKAKLSQAPEDWAAYRSIKNEITADINYSHTNYQNQLFNSKGHVSKRFWKYVKSLRKDRVGVSPLKIDGKDIINGAEKADMLNNQFYSVFTNEDLTNFPPTYSEPFTSMPNISFTTDGILNLLQNLDVNKSSGPDEIPAIILKNCALEIAPILQVIFTQSITTNSIPDDWLLANIVPVFKKGNRSIPSNYRPISLTSICCKLMEHVLYSSIMSHLCEHQILSEQQYGFRQGHSCETQLINVVEDVQRAFDQQKQVDLIMLDFQKAFDTVPHKRLLHKLKSYGIEGQTLKWISLWLTNRLQRVTVDGATSTWVQVKSGVPQGTVLGPLLFLVYINDIGNNISSTLRLFADDCLLYRVIDSLEDVYLLQQDLNLIANWCQCWQMRLNINKCVTLQCYRSFSPLLTNYFIEGHTLERVDQHLYLGVMLDRTMSFVTHINNVISKASKVLNFVKRNLSKCLQSTKEAAYISLVRPTLEYASSVWDPTQRIYVTRIEAIQRRAARWVLNNYSRYSSVTTMLQQLQWPTLEERRRRARLSLFYKARNNLVALQIPDYFITHPHQSRLHHQSSYMVPYIRTSSYMNSFYSRTIKEWNALPPDVATSTALSIFQSNLI